MTLFSPLKKYQVAHGIAHKSLYNNEYVWLIIMFKIFLWHFQEKNSEFILKNLYCNSAEMYLTKLKGVGQNMYSSSGW